MTNSSIDDDIEWLLHDFQEGKMSKNDLKEEKTSASSIIGSNAMNSLFASPFSTTVAPIIEYQRNLKIDPYLEKADLSLLGNIFKDEIDLVPGSIVAVSLLLAFEHTGIYIGDGEFIELYGDGSINRVSTNDFIEGAYKNNDFPARTAMNIYVASIQDRPIVVSRAKERAIKLQEEIKRIEYGVLRNNCHMFTGFCVFGKSFQQNHGCRFFSNLTRMIIEEFSPSIYDFYWRISDHRRT